MVPKQPAAALAPVTESVVLGGSWVDLEPFAPSNEADVRRLDAIRHSTPNLGGAAGRRDPQRWFAPPMVIRSKRSGEAFGLVENGEMIGYPGVAVVLIFIDPATARAGTAMEAFALYVGHVFASGARLVHLEVMAFNKPVLRMLGRIGVKEQARLRDQVYTAGRFWDVLVFAFDATRFEKILSRYARMLPGGDRKPAAIGGRRR